MTTLVTSDSTSSNRPPRGSHPPLYWVAVLAAAVLVVFLVLPLLAIAQRAWSMAGGIDDRTWETLREALVLSLWTTAIALIVIILLGTPLAYFLARRHFRGKALLETLIDLPMVLPPAVAGLALLMAFGRRGLIGETLDGWGITLGFTSTAVILAQIFVASPFFVRSARAGFARADRELEEAAADLGASPLQVVRSVTLPMARSSLAAGAVLAWARAVGEFGATIIFAGNLSGRTQTAPLYIFAKFNEGQVEAANAVAVVLAVFSFVIFSILFFARDWLEAE